MDLKGTQLKQTFGNLVTIGTSAGTPTTGGLENGNGDNITAVGIGTDTPTLGALEVRNNYIVQSDGTRNVYFGSDGTGGLVGTTTNHYLRFVTNNTERVMITNDGNVGIGATSVTSGFKTEIAGGLRVGDTQGEDAVEMGWFNSGNRGFIQVYDRGDSAYRDLLINDSLMIQSDGDIGIGTVSPIVPFHLKGANISNPSNGSGGNETMQVFDTTSLATGVGGGIGFGGIFDSVGTDTVFSEIRE